MGLRCAIVPPTPVPYREPLFGALHERPELEIRVIYQSSGQPSWDVPPDWFPAQHAYPAVHLSSRQHRRSGRTPMLWPHGLERALNEFDPDCVVVSEYGPASLRAFAWCQRHRRAYVIFTECTSRIDPMLSRGQLVLHRWLAGRADGFIAVSSGARERLLAFGVPDEEIAVALQAADVESFRAAAGRARQSAGRAPEPPERAPAPEPGRTPKPTERAPESAPPFTVISVGRLVPDKNFGTLIEAFAQAGLGPPQAQLEIVGTGFLEDQLKRTASRLGVPARFHGHKPPRDLPGLYAGADVYALVSHYEPFGVSVREAAAAGLPIICTRAAGAAGDVAIDGRNAILVDPDSVEQVAAALARLAASAELRRRMAAESRAIDRETDGQEVDAIVDAVLTAAARRGRPRRQPDADRRSQPREPESPGVHARPSKAGSTSP